LKVKYKEDLSILQAVEQYEMQLKEVLKTK
jgi:hypothetical protein